MNRFDIVLILLSGLILLYIGFIIGVTVKPEVVPDCDDINYSISYSYDLQISSLKMSLMSYEILVDNLFSSNTKLYNENQELIKKNCNVSSVNSYCCSELIKVNEVD